ncbi:hypothetical protein DFJ74DRAFT_693033 [Hyaloraphidium curvatum]|nr:hypothetical protein DFJ74DRAFT_693033 [Hyaloraphidium curvatum]
MSSKAAEAAKEAGTAAAGPDNASGDLVAYRPIEMPLQVQEPDYSKGGWLVHTAQGSDVRLIRDFGHIAWCGDAPGLFDTTLPPQLAAKGVRPEQWKGFMDSLAEIMAGRWTVTASLFAVLFVVGIPCVIGTEERFQKKLGMWIRTLNEELLEPVGCYAMLQKSSKTIQTGPNSSYTEERAWMAIALTPEESERLRAEDAFWTTECCGDRLVPSCNNCYCCCTKCVV